MPTQTPKFFAPTALTALSNELAELDAECSHLWAWVQCTEKRARNLEALKVALPKMRFFAGAYGRNPDHFWLDAENTAKEVADLCDATGFDLSNESSLDAETADAWALNFDARNEWRWKAQDHDNTLYSLRECGDVEAAQEQYAQWCEEVEKSLMSR